MMLRTLFKAGQVYILMRTNEKCMRGHSIPKNRYKSKTSENIKAIFKFVFVKAVILSKEVMHVKASHIFTIK